jgi:hypothetical protein
VNIGHGSDILASKHPQTKLFIVIRSYHQLKNVINWRHSKTDCSRNSSPIINYVIILGAFAKLQKATIIFVMYVHLSVITYVRMQQLGSR